jgi:hypothetical protein
MSETIEGVMSLLEVKAQRNETPSTIVMLPFKDDSIRGNSGGFIRLAIAALRASQGENQRFSEKAWVKQGEFITVQGLTFDSDAHRWEPKRLSNGLEWKRWRQSITAWLIILSVLLCLAVGFGTITHWLWLAVKSLLAQR